MRLRGGVLGLNRARTTSLILIATALTVLAGASPAAATRGLITGFGGPVDDQDLARMTSAGAGAVLIQVNWAGIAPQRPLIPQSPADPSYRFGALDQQVEAASAAGLQVILDFTSAPAWAEGRDRPDTAPAGTWRPDPAAVGDFGQALAARYSGRFTPPLASSALPRVRYFEVWNEPNLLIYLTPQWQGKAPASPALYRRMLNSAYAGIKAAQPDAVVVTAGTAPYGESRGVARMRPLLFWRRLLCLRQDSLRATRCPTRAHFDVLAHHPIDTAGGPHHRSLASGDISMPELHKLRSLLRAAERRHTIQPAGRKPLWATEFWWVSDPPNKRYGVPLPRFARWIEGGLYELWRQGASLALNLEVRDAPYDATSPLAYGQGGIFFHNGSKKRQAFTAFSFPFVVHRRSSGRLVAWGKSPRAGTLTIERRRRGGWRKVMSLPVKAGAPGPVFTASMRIHGAATLRATIDNLHSLSQKVHNPRR